MLNKVQLIGNLGRAPEVRALNNGERVTTLNLATTERWKDKTSGERKEKTQWHKVVLFGDGLATVCERYLTTGSKVYVEGQLETRKWQDQSGADRWTTEVVVRSYGGKLTMLNSEPGGNAGHAGHGDEPAPTTGGQSYAAARDGLGGEPESASDLDDDIPF